MSTILHCQKCGLETELIRHQRPYIDCECGESLPVPPDVPHSVMVSQIDAAVATERESCAKIAEQTTAEVDAAMAFLADDETWQWAMNEMSDEASAKWSSAEQKWREIADKIRARGQHA